MAVAKARGTTFGNPNGAAALRRYAQKHGNGAAMAGKARAALERAERYREEIDRLEAEGVRSLSGIATALNTAGERTARGGQWDATAVRRLKARLAA